MNKVSLWSKTEIHQYEGNSLRTAGQNATNESPVSGIALPKDRSININNKWLKAFDSDNCDVLTGITKL